MQELSYAIVTPYSMRKSRTGGIVARLISRTGLDVVGGRMFAPSAELVQRYAETIVTETESRHRATQELIREYVRRNFTGKINGQRPRVLFLVFRGEDAVAKVHRTVGHIVNERTSGETIRDTFGDYIADEDLKTMAARGIYYVPTIFVGDYVAEGRAKEGAPVWLKLVKVHEDTFHRAMKADVKIAFGTDAGVYPHGDNAREFEYMVEAGMPPLEAIMAATRNAADLLGGARAGYRPDTEKCW